MIFFLKNPHRCFNLQKKKGGARGPQARSRGRKEGRPGGRRGMCKGPGRRGGRSGGVSGAGAPEALVGSTSPSCMCSRFVLRLWARLPAGLGRQRGGWVVPSRPCHPPPPAAQSRSGGDSLPWQPRSRSWPPPPSFAGFLPLPPALLPPAASLAESVPFRAAAPASQELGQAEVSPGASRG